MLSYCASFQTELPIHSKNIVDYKIRIKQYTHKRRNYASLFLVLEDSLSLLCMHKANLIMLYSVLECFYLKLEALLSQKLKAYVLNPAPRQQSLTLSSIKSVLATFNTHTHRALHNYAIIIFLVFFFVVVLWSNCTCKSFGLFFCRQPAYTRAVLLNI